jgi:hypothetical protein
MTQLLVDRPLVLDGSVKFLEVVKNEIGAWKIFTLWTGDREARID